MNTNEKISRMREMMEQDGIAAVIIPTDDPHKSEYVAVHFQARKWLTGFSGSAGTAVVTMDRAILWTDFRYYIQAENEISGSEFELFRAGDPDVPGPEKWLADSLEKGSVIGLDGALFSIKAVEKMEKRFSGKGLNLNAGIDFISALWTDRPPMPDSKAFLFDDVYTGQGRADKLALIREKMRAQGADHHLMVSLDDIAWTLNLRGADVHTNPVNISYLLIGPDRADLFIRAGKAGPEVEAELRKDAVYLQPYNAIAGGVSDIGDSSGIWMDPDTVSIRLARSVEDGMKIIRKPGPAVALKAVKNSVQIGHMRDTAVKDGIAVVNFLYWLENQKSGSHLSELSVAEKMHEFRRAQDGFMDNSFDPIMAYSDHSAMCHYKADDESDARIGDDGIFLTDSGGNYLTGTTDITRTICRGTPTPQEVRDYTLVLKGHIGVATILFPKGTRGVQIDTLARQHLWRQGLDFGHGTGHGVGFFLCVHEGPARISPMPVDEKLRPGMLLTNEPGIYREGEYGMRLENMILVRETFENEFGRFLEFEQMTWCHFERELIDVSLLLEEEKEWLNAYHQTVYEKIAPGLAEETAAWLRAKTKAI